MSADVVTLLHGGLGNQMFQYAATLHAARATGTHDIRLILFGDQWSGEEHPLLRDFLDVDLHWPTRADRRRWPRLARGNGLLARIDRARAASFERRQERVVIRQDTPFDAPIPLERGQQVLLDGYFQNLGWIEDTWTEVADALLERAPTGFAALAAERRTAIKLRRSDYVGFGWDMPPDFYLEAMSALDIHDTEVVATCEEPSFLPWFSAVIAPSGCRVAPSVPLTGASAVDDFWNLAAAGRLVLANSSFCWWAAAVAERHAQREGRPGSVQIAYPRPWITNLWSDRPPSDLGLPTWRPCPSGIPETRST